MLVRTECGKRVLVADASLASSLKSGDRVEFVNLGPVEKSRCIRASAVHVRDTKERLGLTALVEN